MLNKALRYLLNAVSDKPADSTAREPRRVSLHVHDMETAYYVGHEGLPRNEIIEHLRAVELGLRESPFNAAPFSDELLHTSETLVKETERLKLPGTHVVNQEDPRLVHIPILSIAGMTDPANLHGPELRIATFGDALFKALHGASLNHASLDHLRSPDVKASSRCGSRQTVMPQIEGTTVFNAKYHAWGGMSFQRFGDRYLADQGKQRAIIAMYAIWQRFGAAGLLYNVEVSEGYIPPVP